MNDNIIYSGVIMISNVKQLKQFLEKQDDSKTLSIYAIDEKAIENWKVYAEDKDYVEIVDGALGKVVIATISP